MSTYTVTFTVPIIVEADSQDHAIDLALDQLGDLADDARVEEVERG